MKQFFFLVVGLIVSGCATSTYSSEWNTKVDRLNIYHDELLLSDTIPAAVKQILYWERVKKEFPEFHDFLTKHIELLSFFAERGNGGKLLPEDQATMNDLSGRFWKVAYSRYELNEDHRRLQAQENSRAFMNASGMFLQMQQQQQRSYDDLNRSIRESGPINCYTKQWHPDGIIHTTCD